MSPLALVLGETAWPMEGLECRGDLGLLGSGLEWLEAAGALDVRHGTRRGARGGGCSGGFGPDSRKGTSPSAKARKVARGGVEGGVGVSVVPTLFGGVSKASQRRGPAGRGHRACTSGQRPAADMPLDIAGIWLASAVLEPEGDLGGDDTDPLPCGHHGPRQNVLSPASTLPSWVLKDVPHSTGHPAVPSLLKTLRGCRPSRDKSCLLLPPPITC